MGVNTYPADWENISLFQESSVKARIGWQGLTAKEYLNQGPYGLVGGTDLISGFINWDSISYVEKYRFDQDTNIQLLKNDILVTKDGTIGKVAIVDRLPQPSTLNSGVYVIRPINNRYDSKFIYYLLTSNVFSAFIDRLAAGSTISHLYQRDLKDFNVTIPKSNNEQKAIAKALSDIDELIEVLFLEKNKLENIRLATLQEIFFKKRFGAANLVVESVVLGEVIKEINDGGTPNTAVTDYFGGQINWAVVDDVVDEIYSTKSTLTESGLQNSSAILWPVGTLILTTGATIGKVGIAMVPTATKQGLCGIQFDFAKVNTKFMKYWFQMNTDLLKSLSQGSTIKEVRPPELKKIKVELPNLSYQDQIVDVILDFDLGIANLDSEINKYECIKQGMANDLLTGKVRLV